VLLSKRNPNKKKFGAARCKILTTRRTKKAQRTQSFTKQKPTHHPSPITHHPSPIINHLSKRCLAALQTGQLENTNK